MAKEQRLGADKAMQLNKAIAKVLKRLRTYKSDLTAEELGVRLGASTTSIREYETAKVLIPMDVLVAYGIWFNLQVNQIIEQAYEVIQNEPN